MTESRREQLQRELAALDETERAAAGTVDTPTVGACPQCGGTFVRAPRPAILRDGAGDPNGFRADKRQAQREKLDAERGPLLQCSGCGYQTRAHDSLEPAATP